MAACDGGHALIRAYIGGIWVLRCTNPGCTYMVRES